MNATLRPRVVGILRPVKKADVGRRVPAARWLTVLTGSGCLLVPWVSVPALSGAIAVTLTVLVLAICVSLGRDRAFLDPRVLLWLTVLGVLTGAVGVTAMLVDQGASVPVVATVVAIVMVTATRAVLLRSRPTAGLLLVLGVLQVGLVSAAIVTASGVIDVGLFLDGGLDALAHGQSPYAITIENPYPPDLTEIYYGPGVVQDGRVMYGFPYLPATLLLDLPVHLVADVSWMHLMVVAAATGLAWRMTTDHLGRAAVLMLALSPATSYVILGYWVETLMVGLLTLCVWGLLRGKRWATVLGLGLLFSSKQYALFFLPALWPVLRRAGWRVLLGAAALGAVVVGAFVLMDPHAFFRSVVELQFKQPFRDDAISLLPGLRAAFGDFPRWALAASPFAGLVVSAFVALRTTPGPTSFSLCVGLGLLTSVLFSKFGFVNYYMFIGSALLLAGVTWPADDPRQTREPSSQGSRGERGISSTR